MLLHEINTPEALEKIFAIARDHKHSKIKMFGQTLVYLLQDSYCLCTQVLFINLSLVSIYLEVRNSQLRQAIYVRSQHFVLSNLKGLPTPVE